jgi:hypothetical protein
LKSALRDRNAMKSWKVAVATIALAPIIAAMITFNSMETPAPGKISG